MQGRTKWVLIYATLRLRPAYAETEGVARLRVSLSLAFYAEARLLPLWSERPKRLRLRQPFWPALGLRVSLMLACYAHTDGVEKQRIR